MSTENGRWDPYRVESNFLRKRNSTFSKTSQVCSISLIEWAPAGSIQPIHIHIYTYIHHTQPQINLIIILISRNIESRILFAITRIIRPNIRDAFVYLFLEINMFVSLNWNLWGILMEARSKEVKKSRRKEAKKVGFTIAVTGLLGVH